MKTEGAEVRSCEGEALASRRNTRRDEDGLGDHAMMGKRAFKRDVAPWHQALRDGEGMRGFTATTPAQYIATTLDADQPPVFHCPDHAPIATFVPHAQQTDQTDRQSVGREKRVHK